MTRWNAALVGLAVAALLACRMPTGTNEPDMSAADTASKNPKETVAASNHESEDLRATLQELYADVAGNDVYYFSGRADLNGDGMDETIVHVVSPMLCGTGGCDTLVLSPGEFGYQLVTDISVTRPPIRVSSRESNGWRNLIVRAGGGGVAARDAELEFDGSSYPTNPTVPPVEPAPDLDGASTIIPEFEDLTDGTTLFPAS